jgi:predicted GIY-YIG superfamily endonuclease
MTSIYALRLVSGKYYIGKSLDVMNRYQQHLNGQGSAWTKKYRPLAIDKIHENASPFDEDKITMEYISKYGVDNVRGGSYSQIELSEFHKDAINMQIRSATDCCTQCGRKGHFAKDCYAKTDVSGKAIEYESESEVVYGCDYCDRTFSTEFGCRVHEKSCDRKKPAVTKKKGTCYRCGRSGHYSPDCYASTDVYGNYLDEDSDEETDDD